MITRFFTIPIVFLIVFFAGTTAVHAQSFQVEPARGQFLVEEVLELNFYMAPGDIDARAFGFTLKYPENLVSVPTVTMNDSLSPTTIQLSSEIDDGQIKFYGVRLDKEYVDPYWLPENTNRHFIGSVKFISATSGPVNFELINPEIYSDNVLSYNHADGDILMKFNNPADLSAPPVGQSLQAGFGDNWFFRDINEGIGFWQLFMGAFVMLIGLAIGMHILDRRRRRVQNTVF